MISLDIDKYMKDSAIGSFDLLIVDDIHVLNEISNKEYKVKAIFINDFINYFVYQKKIINDLEEKIILIDIITKKYQNLNTSLLLKKFLVSKNNPSILNKSDILKNISDLYNQFLKKNKLLDYTLRLKELINSNQFENKLKKIVLYGEFSKLTQIEWAFLRKVFKNVDKLEIISNAKDKIIKSFYEENYSSSNNQFNNFIGFYPIAKFILNLIKCDTNSFLDIKKILENNFISLKELEIKDNEDIVFKGEILNFEQENDIELFEIVGNLEKAGVKDFLDEEEVTKRIENYFYLRKQYAMENEISEQKYEKDFYKTILSWKILKQIISKINFFLNEKNSFSSFLEGIINLLNFFGINSYFKNDKIYESTLDILKEISKKFDKHKYFFDRKRLYIYSKAVLENTSIEGYSIEYRLVDKNFPDTNKIIDFYKKTNDYYNWSEFEGHLLNLKNDNITDFYTSVTQVEEFSICPMKYFFNRKIKVRTNLVIDNELDSILKGNLLHKILENFYLELNKQNYFNNENLNLLSEYCKNLMLDIANKFFEPYNNIMDNLYIQKVKNELLDGLNDNKNRKGILYKVLEKDNTRIKKGWIPSEFEKKFIIEINGLNFSGSIDRIDINSNGEFEILDYKTGNIFLNYKKSEIVSGLSFQLPIYTVAYEKETSKNFHSASYFVLKENFYLDVDIYPIIDKTNYKFLINKSLSNLDKLKNRLLNSKYNYTIENTERVCKSCDYKNICRVNPLKSYYITKGKNKVEKSKKFYNFSKKNNSNFSDEINYFVKNHLINKKILVLTNYPINENNNNIISLFKNEKDFLLKLTEIEEFYDENKNNYLIDKYVKDKIDKLSYKKDKYLELVLQILSKDQIINLIQNVIKSDELEFYINNNFEEVWKNYTKKYLLYCDYALDKIKFVESEIKKIPLINKNINEYITNVNKTLEKIKELINSFKANKNNFSFFLDIKKSDYPIYSRNISDYVSVSLHGEIVNSIYFGDNSLVNILNKFQYFSLEKEYIRAFYKLINEIGKVTYDWKNKNNFFLYNDILKNYDKKNIKNKILSKFDLIIKESSDNEFFYFKDEIKTKSNSLIILEKKNNDFKILKTFETKEDFKMNFVITKKKLQDLFNLPEIISQIKKESKNIGIVTNDESKLKIITELFSKNKIKYLCSGFNIFFFQEVIDIINVLEFINNKSKQIELIGILRSPIFCLNDREIYNICCNSDNIFLSLKDLYPDIYSKIDYWYQLSFKLNISELINFIVNDSKIIDYISLDVNYHTKMQNINKLIEIASKNNDCNLSEFIELIKNCKYTNNSCSENNEYINIVNIEKSSYFTFDTTIYLDTDELFTINQNEDLLIDRNNSVSYIGINILFQNNTTVESFTKMIIKENYEEKILKKIEYNIKKINKMTNNMIIFIMNNKTLNNKFFSKFSEMNIDKINKIFL
jgi:hypothetical protein